MTDTTAALRMACAQSLIDTHWWQDSPDSARELRQRLETTDPMTPDERAHFGPMVLAWAEAFDPPLAVVVRALLTGTPPHAPGMSGLDVLKWYPGQEAREQAKLLNNND